jgi:hypothetical protein
MNKYSVTVQNEVTPVRLKSIREPTVIAPVRDAVRQ